MKPTRKPQAPELLAPAGEPAAAYAAFRFGADAVYAGLQRFSARAQAVNFSPEELRRLCAYAHSLPRPRRVYVTLNTLLFDAELPPLLDSLALCAEAGVDAVIVQDLAVARLARRDFPSLRLHASTQLAIHNLEGVRAAARLGFRRVTLARELSLAEISSIARAAPVETEAFAHGALCYSYSGLCLYSSLLRSRSGNRGACAYPCRDLFASSDPSAPPRLPFSMLDLSAAPLLPRLAASGVSSLKIEGRKKSPLYVAAAVRYYRALLDGSLSPSELDAAARDIQSVFSRPWTTLHLESRWNPRVIDVQSTGHRGVPLAPSSRVARGHIFFTPRLPLEVHDGIQIVLPGQSRPFGFPVDAIYRSDNRPAFSVPPGTPVAVPLPEGAPFIPPSTPLYLASSQDVKRRLHSPLPDPKLTRPAFPLSVTLAAAPDRPPADALLLRLSAAHPALPAPVALDLPLPGPFPPAKNPDAARRAFTSAFEKLGDTPFSLASCSFSLPPPFIPLSRLNEIRRSSAADLARRLDDAFAQRRAAAAADLAAPPPPPAPLPFSADSCIVKTDAPRALLQAFPGHDFPPAVAEYTVVLDPADPSALPDLRAALPPSVLLRPALPVIVRSWEREPLKALVRDLLDQGFRAWEISNLSGLDFLPPPSGTLDVAADWPLYALNSLAAAELFARGLSRLTLSPELPDDQAADLARRFPSRFVWPVRSDPPLFISENCPHAAFAGACPTHGKCGYAGETLTGPDNLPLPVIPRSCRFYTLLPEPRRVPLPPDTPALPRHDFLLRPLPPPALRTALLAL